MYCPVMLMKCFCNTLCSYFLSSEKERRARRQARPVSPGYSTDSNYGSIDVVRKPYPKSARKQQLIEQGMFGVTS